MKHAMAQRSVQAFDPSAFDQYSNLAEAFFAIAERFPEGVTHRQSHVDLSKETLAPDESTRRWVPTVNDVTRSRVNQIAAYLESLGVKKGDRIMILSNPRPEWAEAKVAISKIGGILVTGYTDSTHDQLGYTLYDSEADIVFAENVEQLQKVQACMTKEFRVPKGEAHDEGKAVAKVRKIITFESEGVQPNDSIDTLERIREGFDRSQGPKNSPIVRREDIATLVYTSGTSGAPKGVFATHGQHLANIQQILDTEVFRMDSAFLHVLPFAHAFGLRMGDITMLTPVEGLFPAVLNKRSCKPDKAARKILVGDARTANADLIPVVPRLLELMRDKITADTEKKGFIGSIAVFAGKHYIEKFAAEQEGRRVPFFSALAVGCLEITRVGPMMKRNLAEKLAGSNFRAFISGGAKLPRPLANFYWGIGLPVLEGYGATEANTPFTLNVPSAYKIGSAGRVLSKTNEMKISPEGELLLRGPNIAGGYWNCPEATAKTFKDGWYHSRDGAEIKNEYLYVYGRLDDVEVPETGENINAVDVEEKMNTLPLVEHSVFNAHQRPYGVALVTVRRSELEKVAPELAKVPDITKSKEVRDLVFKQLDETFNKKLAKPYERVRAIAIIDNLKVDAGLTKKGTVQRKVIKAEKRALIDSLYTTIE